MAKTIQWGVIGSGGIARRRTIPEGIVPADNGDLKVVYDVASKANAEVANKFGATAARSIEEVLNSDIDAVYIATPTNLHCEQTKACAAAGKHVLCEKPLGLTVAEAEEAIEACKSAGVLLGTGLMMRFLAQHQAVLKMIHEGKLGTLTYGRAQLSCWYPPLGVWRQDPALGGGGSLIDMGSHCADLLEMFFGPIKKVSCFINNTVHDYKAEDSAIATLFFESGAMGIVDSFFCIPDESSKNILELYGSQGSILARGTVGQDPAGEMTAYLKKSAAGYDAQQARTEERGGLTIAPEPVNTYRAEIEEFSAAVIEGRELRYGAEIGLQNQKVMAACYESAKTGKVVELG